MSGCSPKFEMDKTIEVPFNLGSSEVEIEEKWWRGFEIEQLDFLIEQALQNSPDIITAYERVVQASYGVDSAASSSAPRVTTSASTSYNERKQSGGSWVESESSSLGLSMNYEFDLWGRIQNSRESAQRSLQISQYDLQTVRLSLVGSIVNTYLQWQGVQNKISLTKQNLGFAKEIEQVIHHRYENGVATLVELNAQQRVILGLESSLLSLQNESQALHRAINVLVASNEAIELQVIDMDAIELNPEIAQLPSDLLLKRPDIAAKKEAIRVSELSVEIQQAAKFPTFSLTSALGYASSNLLAFNNPTTTSANIGIGLGYTLFDGGKIEADINIAKSKAVQSLQEYRKTVLNAFKETQDAIDRFQNLEQTLKIDQESFALSEENFALSQIKYQEGVQSYSDLLEEQRSLFSIKEGIVTKKTNYFTAYVELVKALGGGWRD